MKKSKVVVMSILASFVVFVAGPNASAFIGVGSYGETGWQSYSYLFSEEDEGTYKVGFAVSNAGDTSLNSVLLIDNLNFGPSGNESFELGDLTGYTADGDVAVVSSFDSFAGNTYNPTDGTYLARLISSGADTSAYGGTNGSFLWLSDPYTFEAGDTRSFDWAFLAFDYYPFEDFAFLIATEDDEVVYTETLAKIVPGDSGPVIPEPASMLLLGSGLLGMAGIRRKNS